jgi:hypothetical protein
VQEWHRLYCCMSRCSSGPCRGPELQNCYFEFYYMIFFRLFTAGVADTSGTFPLVSTTPTKNEDETKYLFLNYRRNEDEAKYLFVPQLSKERRRSEVFVPQPSKEVFVPQLSKEQRRSEVFVPQLSMICYCYYLPKYQTNSNQCSILPVGD